jgi:adenosylcobyric acid synthase
MLACAAGGYEIRHGRPERLDGAPFLIARDGEEDGCAWGPVIGTSWHGALEHDELRRALLAWVAARRGRRFVPGDIPFAAVREARLDALGDLVAEHLDTARLRALIEGGVPAGLPILSTEVVDPTCSAS